MAQVTKAAEPEPFVMTAKVAEFLSVEEQTLINWRSAGTGPPYHKINGRSVRYRLSEVDAWAESQILNAHDRSQDPVRRELTYRRDKRLEAK